jgi:pilus assembly protein TadC
VRQTHSERGQTSLLIVGFFLVAVLLVVVVVDASAAYLRRQELDALADGAALAAADAVREEEVYTEGLGEGPAQLDPVAAREQVAAYLRSIGAGGRYPGLRYTVSAWEDSVEVRVSTPLKLPFAPPGWGKHTDVSGTAVAVVAVDG